ncbi:unnamed protein product [Clonostachys rosea f. rosea IK726]|uniref:lytic cellulose monooxygenase (C4-dehydrogenating) n=2 Tax=Bionectria ochroleuca TaxID=29856 RepID=A0A0B7KCP3_BIOOC|nr:unnamed protein product [Clonostachys rosea f. rosea IK726]
MLSLSISFAFLLATATKGAAHGFVRQMIVNGVAYGGYLPNKYPSMSKPPTLAAWSEKQTNLGFISPNEYTTPHIVCHRDAENAGGYVTVKAGDSVWLQWNGWPTGHVGPILDYLAPCGSKGCEAVDKSSLKFFKIADAGLRNGTNKFYTDVLAQNKGWLIRIPEKLKPGDYVLRHEIIALHGSGKMNGAQNYPQCFNIKVEGSGTELPDGMFATQFYKPDDMGILVSVYGNFHSYRIPGPGVIDIGGLVEQAISTATSTANATISASSTATGSIVSTSSGSAAKTAGQTSITTGSVSGFETRVRSSHVPKTSAV